MARKKRRGGTRRPSATEEVESSLNVKEEVKRMKQQEVTDLNPCVHYASRSTELKKILERVKSSSWKDIFCEECDVDISESVFLWVCLDCEHIFCGDEDVSCPTGHIFDHGRVNNHLGCMRLDIPNKIWCSICAVNEKESAMDIMDEQEGMEEELYNPYFYDHCPCASTQFMPIIEGIKSSSWKDFIFSCQACCVEASESTFLWVCLCCEHIMCGGENDLGPTGHIDDHAEAFGHLLCTRLDMPSKVWCYGCNKKVELPTVVEGEQQGMIQQEVDVPVSESKTVFVVKKLPNYQMNCYFNSVLQNLFAMDRLRQRLASLEQPGGNVTNELKRHFAESCDDSVQTINPLNLCMLLCMEGRFLPGHQEDSHELLLYLLGKLESEETKFVNELFHGELSSVVCCTRCGNISRTYDDFSVLSLEMPLKIHTIKRDGITEPMDNVPPAREGYRDLVEGTARRWITEPMDNVPPAREGYGDLVEGTARRSLIDDFFEGKSPCLFPEDAESDDPPNVPSGREEDEGNGSYDLQTYYNYPEGSEWYDFSGYNKPGAPDSSDASPDSILADLTGKRCVRKHHTSSDGEVDMNGAKEELNESIIVSDRKISIGKDVDADLGVVGSDEACGVDDASGLSIEKCLDSYTRPEYMFDKRCEHCSPLPKSQRRQKPSEESDIQEDGVKSGSKMVSGSPSDIGDQKNVGLDGHNLAAPPRSSQDDPETEQVRKDKDMEIKCKDVQIKAEKRLLIKRPPLILAIHLKRYIHLKIENHVIFKEKLDLTPYMDLSSDEDEQYVYHLTGVVEHEGSSINAGHYFAYVRRTTSQGVTAWFKANDEVVEEVPLEQVLRSKVYMLFFERDGDEL